MKLRTFTLGICAIGLALSGCASNGSDSVGATGTPVAVAVSGEIGSEPAVEITPGDPATELIVDDLVVGEGESLPAGAELTAHYVGYGAASGMMFDSSWSRGEPATFPLNNVILGWQEGLVGMQVGGRRSLIIPAELGYGDNPPPGSGIAAGETLIFVVDLVSFQAS